MHFIPHLSEIACFNMFTLSLLVLHSKWIIIILYRGFNFLTCQYSNSFDSPYSNIHANIKNPCYPIFTKLRSWVRIPVLHQWIFSDVLKHYFFILADVVLTCENNWPQSLHLNNGLVRPQINIFLVVECEYLNDLVI